MKADRSKIVVLGQVLDSLTQYRITKFAYAVARNMQRVEPEIKAIREARKPIADFKIYDEARVKLCNDLAQKTPTGEPAAQNGKYVFINPQDAYTQLEALKETHKEILDRQKQKAEGEDKAFMAEEIDFDPFLVKFDLLPEDLSADVIKVLMDCGIVVAPEAEAV